MRLLFIEPFDGGSHRRFLRTLVDGLTDRFDADATVLTLPARHWKWRMRGSVAWLAQEHDAELRSKHDLVFVSSFVPLAELIGLYPRLGSIPRVLYFHENQLTYPVRQEFSSERDHHYGFTQMMSALAATRCVFNSQHNMEGFLAAGDALLRRMPDARPMGWAAAVASRSEVLGVPMELPDVDTADLDDAEFRSTAHRVAGPILLFNHRWEHDKNPGAFFAAARALNDSRIPFRLAVCGERFAEVPDEIKRARREFADRVVHWGFVGQRADYFALLQTAHVAVSTSDHEFFGLASLEATYMGARPIVPDRLSYPELFPAEFRYQDQHLPKDLARLCADWIDGRSSLRGDRRDLVAPYRAERMVERYFDLFCRLIG